MRPRSNQVSYTPPFVPESREDEETIYDRVARARKARKEAANRVARRYAAIKPDKRTWRADDTIPRSGRPHVL